MRSSLRRQAGLSLRGGLARQAGAAFRRQAPAACQRPEARQDAGPQAGAVCPTCPVRPAPGGAVRDVGLPGAGRAHGAPARRVESGRAVAWSKAGAAFGAAPVRRAVARRGDQRPVEPAVSGGVLPRRVLAAPDGKPQAAAVVSRVAAAQRAAVPASDVCQQVAAEPGARQQVAVAPGERQVAAGAPYVAAPVWLPVQASAPALPSPCPTGPAPAGCRRNAAPGVKPEPPAQKQESTHSPAITVWCWSSSSLA